MNKILIALLVIINIPLFGALASILFGKRGIFDAIRYLFVPDIISAFRGEYWDDKWAEIMFTLWVALCVILVVSEYNYIETNYPEIFSYLMSLFNNQSDVEGIPLIETYSQ